MWPFFSRPSLPNGDRRESGAEEQSGIEKDPEEVDYFYLDGFFSENPPDKFSCPICLCPVQRESYLTECCGRHFCHECIVRLVGSKPCPMCKSSPLAIFPNKERQREINALAVCCPVSLVDSKVEGEKDAEKPKEVGGAKVSEEGDGENCSLEENTKCLVCDWKGELGQLEAHLKAEHANDRRWRIAEKTLPETAQRQFSLTQVRSVEDFLGDFGGLLDPRLRPRLRLDRRLGGYGSSQFRLSRSGPWQQDLSDDDSDDSDSESPGIPVFRPSNRMLFQQYSSSPDAVFAGLSLGHGTLETVNSPLQLNNAAVHNNRAAETQLESQLESSLNRLSLATEYSNANPTWDDSSERPGVEETLSEGRGVVGLSGPHPIGRVSGDNMAVNRHSLVSGRRSDRESNEGRGNSLSAFDCRPPTPHSNYLDFPLDHHLPRPRQRHHHAQHHQNPFHSPPRAQLPRPHPPPPHHHHYHHHHHRHQCPHQHSNDIPPPENRRSQHGIPTAPSDMLPPPFPPAPPPPHHYHHHHHHHHRRPIVSPTDFPPFGFHQLEGQRHSAFNPFLSAQHPYQNSLSAQHHRPPQPPPHPPPLDADWYATPSRSPPGSTSSSTVWHHDPPRPASPPPWHVMTGLPRAPSSPPQPAWFVHSPAPSPSPHGLQQAVLQSLGAFQPHQSSQEDLRFSADVSGGTQDSDWSQGRGRSLSSSTRPNRPDTPF